MLNIYTLTVTMDVLFRHGIVGTSGSADNWGIFTLFLPAFHSFLLSVGFHNGSIIGCVISKTSGESHVCICSRVPAVWIVYGQYCGPVCGSRLQRQCFNCFVIKSWARDSCLSSRQRIRASKTRDRAPKLRPSEL